ncbi:CPXCG motif-containing cysteine-rich protein [Litoribacter ruber]|uniref:CPXCG motif-containing cysteine-rich protein n=1 Tax=Litoribacter ruber TaxID=702568 RepID=A0AAP2CEL5_9BACT|nr:MULTISPECIES: CPXCG motif-containing cysteine-rich protein [Litoribacter]MBS9523063.1 CPXCG motif-containing cysteine-rich protein [Litoribacter alkaliphilus]MBT0810773.1 CPXCG motif-containing cysteine-rich protein [Litoribacter ruber]
MLEEHFFTCPYCFSNISVLLDPSIAAQTYIEDCEICCKPIEIKFFIENGELSFFSAQSIEQ